jgi:3-hydroxyisobutyrate dehydrogenase
MSAIKIGWTGLGNMGIPMSQQLVKAGYTVTVYNRTKEKEAALTAMGAAIADTPAALMQESDVVFIMVSDDEAIRNIFTADNGLLSAGSTGKTIVNMSTVSPAVSKEMYALCRQQGNDYLDAPVSGSVKQAENGQLVIMAGGDEQAYEQIKPLLAQLGKLSMYLGPAGSGNMAKLAINTLLGLQTQAMAEAVLFAQQHGVKTEDFLNIINNSALSNVYMKIKGEAILNDNYQAAFAMKHIVKDLGLAKAEGLATPMVNIAYETFKQAAATYGTEDLIAVIKAIQ